MSTTTKRPASLLSNSHVTLILGRADDSLTLHTEDGQSHALGYVSDMHEDAVPYLTRAFQDARLADDAASTAINFGVALVDIERRVSCSVDLYNPEDHAREILNSMFGEHFADLLGRPSDESDAHIDMIANRAPAGAR